MKNKTVIAKGPMKFSEINHEKCNTTEFVTLYSNCAHVGHKKEMENYEIFLIKGEKVDKLEKESKQNYLVSVLKIIPVLLKSFCKIHKSSIQI